MTHRVLGPRWRPCKRPKCLRQARWLREVVAERDAAVEACQFVKDWLRKLESSVDPGDDVLRDARARYHAPIHAKLDPVLEGFQR